MKRLPLIFMVVAGLGWLCLPGCSVQYQPVAQSHNAAVAYTLDTPLSVIENDPAGNQIILRDVPDVKVNPNYQMSPLNSLMDIENLSGSTIPPQQLARVQVDLAQLSNREQAAQSPSYVAPPPIYTTSFVCADGNTAVQNAVCQNPQLASLDVQMGALVRQLLGDNDVFERDQVLASQRAWLLGLGAACGLTGASAKLGNAGSVSCLAGAYQSRIAALQDWTQPPLADANSQGAALAKYVTYKLLDAKQPALCQVIGSQAAGALRNDGAIDPARLGGADEIAGSHGQPSGPNPQGGSIFVDLYRAGLYGGYQKRARGVTLGGATAPMISPETLGNYVETLPNGGGRFVNFPSQTGEYGAIDVFRYQGQLLALVTDTVGYNSPASPGEAAVAGVFSISQGAAAPACLYETFLMPPPIAMGVFGAQPSLTPFLALIAKIQGLPPDNFAPSDRQDLSYFQAELDWTMFYMPLVISAQVQNADWTGLLRSRHDQVLDSLYAWSQKSQQNQAEFNQLFALLTPAAKDLDTVLVQQQGLSAAQAEQATAIAMMELLYQTTYFIDPGLGAGPVDPASYANYRPRYPILANPQS
jgi:uncharacterized protein